MTHVLIAGTPYNARHAKQVRQTALIHRWATRIRAIAHDDAPATCLVAPAHAPALPSPLRRHAHSELGEGAAST